MNNWVKPQCHNLIPTSERRNTCPHTHNRVTQQRRLS